MSQGPVLLYDGRCALCSRTVLFVLRHERTHTLRFAPLTGRLARDVIQRRAELAGVDSVVWVEDPDAPGERPLTGSEAVLRLARYMGGPWRALAVGRIVPRVWRDRLYELLARHRHRIVGGAKPLLPDVVASARFLD
ncbi:MAG: thiol-disulfide oxidoreductase DCC family protein [Gemmatimonadaceae bacterium]